MDAGQATLFAATHVATRWHRFVVRRGEQLSRTIATRTPLAGSPAASSVAGSTSLDRVYTMFTVILVNRLCIDTTCASFSR